MRSPPASQRQARLRHGQASLGDFHLTLTFLLLRSHARATCKELSLTRSASLDQLQRLSCGPDLRPPGLHLSPRTLLSDGGSLSQRVVLGLYSLQTSLLGGAIQLSQQLTSLDGLSLVDQHAKHAPGHQGTHLRPAATRLHHCPGDNELFHHTSRNLDGLSLGAEQPPPAW
jgi:hypothetical protein